MACSVHARHDRKAPGGVNQSVALRKRFREELLDAATHAFKIHCLTAYDVGFSLPLEYLGRNNIFECFTHEITPSTRPNELVTRNAAQEVDQITIEVRVAIFVPDDGLGSEVRRGLPRHKQKASHPISPYLSFIPLLRATPIAVRSGAIGPACTALFWKPRDHGGRIFSKSHWRSRRVFLELNSSFSFSLLRVHLMILAFPLSAIRPEEGEVEL
jgi:hypothetical protein